ncbi:extracellular solute-binding protein [Mesorhizobium sp.]|uniref:ABC transporter substrate-binding protein n=1 Tax=Mesorhizobium sp. TaxID=1871066 RepID=UPI0011FABFCB|nr:extracellular solute-binding protein [Mesorhizobium sp.]TIL34622.1 MAG: extracellular solute-binding protein [Mesorhizobium sp.]TIM48621.1 MAG: extracellular solute-binding protein [Mesorhizobium sp.]
MKRRTFLKFATAATMSTLAAPYVHAQEKKFAGVTLRVAGWGGTYDEAIKKNVAEPLEERTGMKVEITAGTQSADLVRLVANRDNPPFDIYQADSAYMVDALKADLVQEIKEPDVPNLKRLLPGFREYGDYGVPYSTFTYIPIFNSDEVERPLESYTDLLRPDLKGKIVLPAATFDTYWLFLLGIAEENGGSITNMEPAFRLLEQAKDNVVALGQSTVAMIQMVENGEVAAAVLSDARGYELRAKGLPVISVFPPKGIYGATSYMNIPKNAKNTEAALAFLNEMLSDEGMLALPKAMRLGVTTDVKLPQEIAKDLTFNSPERIALKKSVDWKQWMGDRSARIERTNKILRG